MHWLATALILLPIAGALAVWTLPLSAFPQSAWYPIVSAHLIIALGISIRLLRLSRRELGLCRGNLALQLLLMGGGLGLAGSTIPAPPGKAPK